jgi:Virulence protein RhuM family
MTETLPGPAPDDSGEFILYQTEDGQTRIDVRMADETVWLSQKAMADLFQVTVPNVSQHLKSIYEEGELRLAATVQQYLIVQTEGRRQVSRSVDHYNLDAILAVGYRVRSHRGTQFRIWATERLREYLIKGFAMDDARLKRAGGGNYFEELLARIRDIRSSERVFWRKVLDIYSTSIDYESQASFNCEVINRNQNREKKPLTIRLVTYRSSQRLSSKDRLCVIAPAFDCHARRPPPANIIHMEYISSLRRQIYDKDALSKRRKRLTKKSSSRHQTTTQPSLCNPNLRGAP